MSRVRMVTRTIDFTVANVMTLNVNTCEVSVNEYRINGVYNNEKEVLKNMQKCFETDCLKLVKIDSFHTESVLFGMKESIFMELAEVLPPRTVGIIDTEE